MPKFAQEKLDAPTMRTQDTTQRERTQVVASPVSTYVRPAENNLIRLSEALGQFGTQTMQVIEKHQEIEGEREELLGFKTNKGGETLPPEASPQFQKGYLRGHWDTAATNATSAATEEYYKLRDKPDFQLDEFLQKRVQADLKGVSSPDAIKIYMDRFGKLGAGLKDDFTKHHVGLMYEKRDADYNIQQSSLLDRLARVDGPMKLDHAGFFTEWKSLQESFKDQGKTTVEMTSSLLDAVNAKSRQMKGNTELYDLFYQKDPATGQSPVDLNPKLAEAVEKARYTAHTMYENNIQRESHLRNGDTVETMWDAIRTGRFDEVSDAALQNHRTQHGALWDNSTYHSIRAARDKGMQDAKLASIGVQAALAGDLWQHTPETQKAALEQITAPEIKTITENIDSPHSQEAGVAVQRIVQAHSTTRASVPSEQLKRLTGTVKQFAPSSDQKDAKVPERFKNLAEIYRAMASSTNGGLVDMYFDEDSKFVMEEYVKSTGNRMDESSAYRQAFRTISPEMKKIANDYANSPEGRLRIKESVTNVTTGMGVDEGSARPNALRTTGASMFGIELWRGSIPTNQEIVQAGAHTEAYRYLRAGGSQASLEDHLKGWARSRFVHDAAANKLVEVPPGMANRQTSEAISAFTEELHVTYGTDAGVRFDHMGNGKYSVILDKQNMRIHPDVSLDEMRLRYTSKTALNDPERGMIAGLQNKAQSGLLTTQDIADNNDLINKATSLGLWRGEAKKQSDFITSKAGSDLGLLVKEAKLRGLSAGPISFTTGTIPDLAAKRPVAQLLMKSGDVSGALSVMGEGVALKAYKDPSKGTNIGIGYNIDMNIKTAADDFRRAGITASVDDIHSGKVGISTEQAVRLYKVVQPRYTAIAQEAFDKRYKEGAFESLSAPERAVLVDIAYQSGKNVSKFTELFDQMMTKQEISPNALNLSWKDATSGAMHLDLHRRNLRLNLLLGKFDLGMKHAGIN